MIKIEWNRMNNCKREIDFKSSYSCFRVPILAFQPPAKSSPATITYRRKSANSTSSPPPALTPKSAGELQLSGRTPPPPSKSELERREFEAIQKYSSSLRNSPQKFVFPAPAVEKEKRTNDSRTQKMQNSSASPINSEFWVAPNSHSVPNSHPAPAIDVGNGYKIPPNILTPIGNEKTTSGLNLNFDSSNDAGLNSNTSERFASHW